MTIPTIPYYRARACGVSTSIFGKNMLDAVRNKDRWDRRRAPTQYPSTDLQAVVQQAKLCCFLWHVVPLQILGVGIVNPAPFSGDAGNTEGYSSTYLAMEFANVRAGTWYLRE